MGAIFEAYWHSFVKLGAKSKYYSVRIDRGGNAADQASGKVSIRKTFSGWLPFIPRQQRPVATPKQMHHESDNIKSRSSIFVTLGS
jgi:hypothetical protein